MIAMANIKAAPAILLMLGTAALAPARVLTNTLAPVRATPAAQVPPAVANIPPVPAPAAMNGTAAAARNKCSTVQLESCIIAMVRWLA